MSFALARTDSSSSTSTIEGGLSAPDEAFWERFSAPARKVQHLITTPQPGATYEGRDFLGIAAAVKRIWGFFQIQTRSDPLLEQSLSDLLTVRTFLHELCSMTGVPFETKRFMALQALSYLIAYREPDLFKEHFHTFTFDFPKADGSTATYRLEEVIDMGGGIKAFGFVADGEPPILLYHGTFAYRGNPACLPTVMADLERGGVGHETFMRNKEKIAKWLQSHTTSDQKAIVSGHSLGAAFGTYTGVYCPDHVQEVTVFSAPGVGQETRDTWDKLDKTSRPAISAYNAAGDVVCQVGGDHIVGDVYTGSHPDLSTSPLNEMELHKVPLFFTRKGFSFSKETAPSEKTRDLRYPLLTAGTLPLAAGLGIALNYLIPFLMTAVPQLIHLVITAVLPCITHLFITAVLPFIILGITTMTWPVALATAVLLILIICEAVYLYKRHQAHGSVEYMIETCHKRYVKITDLYYDLKSGQISPKEFAFYYKTQFYSSKEVHLPFKVALLRELTRAHLYNQIGDGQLDFENMSESDAIKYLFHPELLIDSLEIRSDVKATFGNFFNTSALRRDWAKISAPDFLQQLQVVKIDTDEIQSAGWDWGLDEAESDSGRFAQLISWWRSLFRRIEEVPQLYGDL